MQWMRIDSQIMTAVAEAADGDLIRLFVAPRPEGRWDWRVWDTGKGQFHRSGVESTAPDAVTAAERAAAELSRAPAGAGAAVQPGTGGPAAALPPQPHDGRTFEKVLGAFHMACDQSDLEVATALLRVMDHLAMRRPPPEGRRSSRVAEQLVAAYTRHWQLTKAGGP
jgi:hypothetical protein